MSITAVWAADKEPKFSAGPVEKYPARQTNAKVTVAASVYETDDQARPAFGKHNPYKYGILPILVVIQNDGNQAIRVDQIRVEYIGPDRSRLEATPANDIRYLSGGRKPNVTTGPVPTGGPRVKRGKSPLDLDAMELRAFAAKMIPPGESASGFFYFQTGHRGGSRLYVTGITEANSGKDLFYFEIPLPRPA